nr:hypothetical protein [uncultured Vibrio sp.]
MTSLPKPLFLVLCFWWSQCFTIGLDDVLVPVNGSCKVALISLNVSQYLTL